MIVVLVFFFSECCRIFVSLEFLNGICFFFVFFLLKLVDMKLDSNNMEIRNRIIKFLIVDRYEIGFIWVCEYKY